jgi:hypothetical protein
MTDSLKMLFLCAALPASAFAAETFEFGGTAGLGYEYDSNVAVLDLDTASGESDTALQAEAGISAKWRPAKPFSAMLGYNFNDTRHSEFSAFDLTIHRISADLAYDFGALDVGLLYHDIHARLDDDGFLDIQQVNPYVSYMMNKRLLLRAGYAHSEKDFLSNAERVADNDGLSVDGYWFVDGLNRYVVMGLKVDREDAVDSQFDYRSDRIKLQFSQRFEAWEKPATMKLRTQYDVRDYDNVTESIGERREDKRFRAGVSTELELTEWLEVEGVAELANNQSNLASVNFSEKVYTLNLSASF